MTDVFDAKKRSAIMGRVRGADTKPEWKVRSAVHAMGYRHRLHRADLPGKPDLVLPRHRKAIFVHGCFWHGHEGCPRSKRPTSNRDFWDRKLDRNMDRDRRFVDELRRMGWDVLIVWECETRKPEMLQRILEGFLSHDAKRSQRGRGSRGCSA